MTSSSLYCKKDLPKFKKIRVLKKFGLKPSKIQNLLENDSSDVFLNLEEQLKILETKMTNLSNTYQELKEFLNLQESSESIIWDKAIEKLNLNKDRK